MKATHDPRPSAGLSVTPCTTTLRSLRGKLTLTTPPGLGVPFRPSAFSTTLQSGSLTRFVRLAWAAAPSASTKEAQQTRREHRRNATAELIVSRTTVQNRRTTGRADKEAPVRIELTNSRFAVCRLTTWPRRRATKLSGPEPPEQSRHEDAERQSGSEDH